MRRPEELRFLEAFTFNVDSGRKAGSYSPRIAVGTARLVGQFPDTRVELDITSEQTGRHVYSRPVWRIEADGSAYIHDDYARFIDVELREMA